MLESTEWEKFLAFLLPAETVVVAPAHGMVMVAEVVV